MSESRSYAVRPHPNNAARTDMTDLFWVYLSPANLLLHGLKNGDACQFETALGASCSAIVFDNPKLQDSVVQTSKTFQGLYDIKLGDRISVHSSQNPILNAQDIVLRETSQTVGHKWLTDHERHFWAWILEDTLQRAVYLCPGLPFDKIEARRQKRSFQIIRINGSSDLTVYRFIPEMNVNIHVENGDLKDDTSSTTVRDALRIPSDEVAGLDRQLAQINLRLTSYDEDRPVLKFPTGYSKRRGGIVICGPSGTGKTLILDKIAKLSWRRVVYLDDHDHYQRLGDRADFVRKAFASARREQPSVIIIRRLEAIAGRPNQDNSSAVNMTSLLASQLDALDGTQVLVVAETNNIASVDDEVRKLGRLDFEVEMTVPDSNARKEILRLASGLAKNTASALLDRIGNRTHGYVGADLFKLFWQATDKAKGRIFAGQAESMDKTDGTTEPMELQEITEEDLNSAMVEIRPSAMREVFLETPKVRWDDIGGQHHVKKSLKQAIEWPFKVIAMTYGHDLFH